MRNEALSRKSDKCQKDGGKEVEWIIYRKKLRFPQ